MENFNLLSFKEHWTLTIHYLRKLNLTTITCWVDKNYDVISRRDNLTNTAFVIRVITFFTTNKNTKEHRLGWPWRNQQQNWRVILLQNNQKVTKLVISTQHLKIENKRKFDILNKWTVAENRKHVSWNEKKRWFLYNKMEILK